MRQDPATIILIYSTNLHSLFDALRKQCDCIHESNEIQGSPFRLSGLPGFCFWCYGALRIKALQMRERCPCVRYGARTFQNEMQFTCKCALPSSISAHTCLESIQDRKYVIDTGCMHESVICGRNCNSAESPCCPTIP